MKKIIVKDCNIPSIDENIACIGYFDGVHKGHQALIKVAKDLALMNNLKSMVICFDPDPLDIINKTKNKHIMSFKDRLSCFEELGIDIVCIIKFNEGLMNIKAEDFINDYLFKLNINTLVCGYDFSFGQYGKGNQELLATFMNTVVVEQINYYGKKISSTRIKEGIVSGNFKLVNKLLGYKYSLLLKVIKCAKNGSKWLVECVPNDTSLLIPTNLTYKDFYCKDNKIYLLANSKIETKELILLEFDNE